MKPNLGFLFFFVQVTLTHNSSKPFFGPKDIYRSQTFSGEQGYKLSLSLSLNFGYLCFGYGISSRSLLARPRYDECVGVRE